MSLTSITDVKVIAGDEDVAAPAGFTRIHTDLNLGAGGDYVYLCYQQQDGVPAITDLAVISGSNANINPPEGYTKIPVDLNKGAGGAYIYICYSYTVSF